MDLDKKVLAGILAGGLVTIGLMTEFARPQLAQARASSPVATGGILDIPVRNFKVQNSNMAEALLALRSSDADHIVIGFERFPHLRDDTSGPISLAVTSMTLGQIVQRLCQADARYEYQVIDGSMVDVRPGGATTDPTDPLNIVVEEYTVNANIAAAQAIAQVDNDAPELGDFLRRKREEWVKRTGEREGGAAGSIISGNMPPPRFVLHLRNLTVRQILDAISLKSIAMFQQGPHYGPTGMPLKMAPTGWEYDFIVDPDAPTGLGGYPKWSGF